MTGKYLRLVIGVCLAGATLGWALNACAEAPAQDVTELPPFDRFLIVPLRVHILTADDLPEVDCHLSDDDVTRILGKVNTIWNRAGIHWGLESLVREPAAHQEKFRLARRLDESANLGLFRILIPDGTRPSVGLHVYYIHRFPVNGVWMGDDFAIVQETARLKPVEGGIDEPIPRVTAHELGHALGLSHRQARTNLLASGTTGTLLNSDEVEVSRRRASRIPGVRTVRELRRDAEKAAEAQETALARRAWTWLAQIPGEGAAEARKRLEELDPRPTRETTKTGDEKD